MPEPARAVIPSDAGNAAGHGVAAAERPRGGSHRRVESSTADEPTGIPTSGTTLLAPLADPREGTADPATVETEQGSHHLVPAQRSESEPTSDRPVRDRNGRFIKRSQFEPLPDLAAHLAAVPGGLGLELPAAFTFAGINWTPPDARPDGSPIGLRLAWELHQGDR
jgi:hypothetical protein